MPDQVTFIVICLLHTFFSGINLIYLIILVFNPEKLQNVCLYVSFLDINIIMFSVSGSMVELYFT